MIRARLPRADRRAGFTLVELLVVIGIIALLISVLLPALGSARRQANTVKCLAALRQIGNAFQLYAVDHKGYMPVAVHETSSTRFPTPFQLRWTDQVGRYITKIQITSMNDIVKLRERSVLWGCPEWSAELSLAYASGNALQIQNALELRPGYGMLYYGPDWFRDGAAGVGILTAVQNSDYYYLTGTRGRYPRQTDVRKSSSTC